MRRLAAINTFRIDRLGDYVLRHDSKITVPFHAIDIGAQLGFDNLTQETSHDVRCLN
jgi:hypothetical protein